MKNIIYNFHSKLLSLHRKLLSGKQKNDFLQNPKNKIHPSFRIGYSNHFIIDPLSNIEIGENVAFVDNNFLAIKKDAKFKVGKGTVFSKVSIGCMGEIEFGENCLIGGGSKFFDGDHINKFDENGQLNISPNEFKTAPIKIGNNVWTGADCIILKGVTIGDNVILSPGSVIFKDIPANSLVLNKQNLEIRPLKVE